MNKILEIIQKGKSAGEIFGVKENTFPPIDEFDSFLMIADKKVKTVHFSAERQRQALMELENKNGAKTIAFFGVVGESVLIDLDSLWIRGPKDEKKIGEALYQITRFLMNNIPLQVNDLNDMGDLEHYHHVCRFPRYVFFYQKGANENGNGGIIKCIGSRESIE